MDPVTVAAMIKAGSDIALTIFEKWSGQTGDQKTRAFVAQHYDLLRGLVSDNCMRILKRMEDGQNRSVGELLRVLYPSAEQLGTAENERLRSEFEYRLYFLTLAGLMIRPTREFYITEVGKYFVTQARERKDYFRVLFD